MNFKEELDNIEKQVRENDRENIRLEEQLKQSEKERTELLAQLKEEDVTEENLIDTEMELEQDLQNGISKCHSILEK